MNLRPELVSKFNECFILRGPVLKKISKQISKPIKCLYKTL